MATETYHVDVNGKTLPASSSMVTGYYDIDFESGRNVNDGILVRQRLREKLAKVELSWNLIDREKMNIILNSDIRNAQFNCTSFDESRNQFRTYPAYIGDVSIEKVNGGKSGLLFNLSFNIIEM